MARLLVQEGFSIGHLDATEFNDQQKPSRKTICIGLQSKLHNFARWSNYRPEVTNDGSEKFFWAFGWRLRFL